MRMVIDMKGNGLKVKRVAREYIFMRMVIFMKVNGKLIRDMVLVV